MPWTHPLIPPAKGISYKAKRQPPIATLISNTDLVQILALNVPCHKPSRSVRFSDHATPQSQAARYRLISPLTTKLNVLFRHLVTTTTLHLRRLYSKMQDWRM